MTDRLLIKSSGRPILCPSSSQPSGRWERSADNKFWRPKGTRYPDSQVLEAGDIILFRPVKPSVTERLIQAYEKGTFTHAAVYLQADHEICESAPKTNGVAITSLEDRLKGNCILVRRVPHIDREGRAEIAKMVTSLMNSPYGFGPICESVIRRLFRVKLDINLTTSLKDPVICSTLCEHGILAATKGRRYLTNRTDMLLMPEDLASTDILEDVNITWKAVEI